MNQSKSNLFISKLSEALDFDSGQLSLETRLDTVNLDSIGIISSIAIIDDIYGVNLTIDMIMESTTFRDLIDLVERIE
tara:strand:+ start:597 stop:830 length:234 start_codon:yes stop_codon:yes gene_type:complete